MAETKKKLYPFQFVAGKYEKPWGKEFWTVADMGFEDSEIRDGWLAGNSMSDLMETYLERVVGEDVYQYYGRQFPVLVKFADVSGKTALMVHPGDEVAMERYDALGKAELVYVAEAEAGAKLCLGFNRDVTASEFYEKCLDGSIYELLNEIDLEKGSHYLIEPGTVHAFHGNMKLVFVSESSDANFIMHDPNASSDDREMQTLHISEAMDFIDFCKFGECHCHHNDHSCDCGDDHECSCGDDHCTCGGDHECSCGDDHCTCGGDHHEDSHSHHHEDEKIVNTLAERAEFNVTKLNLTDPLHIYTEKFGSFIVYVCVEGELSIQVPTQNVVGEKGMENYIVGKGEAVLIPAEMPDFFLVPRDRDTLLLEVVTRPVDELDEYIDPSTEPFLEGEDYGGLNEEDFEDLEDLQEEEK